MTKKKQTRREFLSQSGAGLIIFSLPFPLTAFANFNKMNDTFHNYEEALKKPLEVKVLSFSFNNSYHPYTTSLPDERIKTLVNLEKLHISGFKGEHINLPNEISELRNLKELSIYAENLVEIPKVIWTLKSLTDLFLEINFLKDNDLELSNLTQLQSFGIKVHKTEIISERIFDNSNITRFYLQSDDLKAIPNYFDRLPNLNHLTLHCQNLDTIPSTISYLSKLKSIDLYNKSAKSINVNFGLLERLEEFRWGQSLFFPLSLTDAQNLKRLNFDVSYFETIDANDLAFQNLQQLELSFRKLKKIPKCFETLKGVQSLILGYNNFNEIEFDFHQLTQLTYLSFRRCENFDKIDMKKFISSIKTIRNLRFLETPTLSKEQKIIRRGYKFEFDWVEE